MNNSILVAFQVAIFARSGRVLDIVRDSKRMHHHPFKVDAAATMKAINRHCRRRGIRYGDAPTWFASYPQTAQAFDAAARIFHGDNLPGRYLPIFA